MWKRKLIEFKSIQGIHSQYHLLQYQHKAYRIKTPIRMPRTMRVLVRTLTYCDCELSTHTFSQIILLQILRLHHRLANTGDFD